jgi:hypothetical protein
MVAALLVAVAPAAADDAGGPARGSGEPRALVLDVSGPVAPGIEAFDELNDGASVVLEAGTELTLTYYPTCEDLTIRGGHIRIAGEKMMLDKGELVARGKGQCPGNVKLSAVDVVNAAVVTRAVRKGPVISTAPKRIGLTGAGADKYTRVGVYGAGGTVFEAPLEGRGAAWPAGTPALTAGGQYTIVFTGPDIQTFAAKVTPDTGASPVTVFRIP